MPQRMSFRKGFKHGTGLTNYLQRAVQQWTIHMKGDHYTHRPAVLNYAPKAMLQPEHFIPDLLEQTGSEPLMGKPIVDMDSIVHR